MMRKRIFCAGALALIVACDRTVEPVVSSFNGDSVEIQISDIGFLSEESIAQARVAADAQAADICARGPNKTAEYVSTRTIPTANAYVVHQSHLYLCLN